MFSGLYNCPSYSKDISKVDLTVRVSTFSGVGLDWKAAEMIRTMDLILQLLEWPYFIM